MYMYINILLQYNVMSAGMNICLFGNLFVILPNCSILMYFFDFMFVHALAETEHVKSLWKLNDCSGRDVSCFSFLVL